jgi:ABC-type multidrug transport system fused ATPase/permease subunit
MEASWELGGRRLGGSGLVRGGGVLRRGLAVLWQPVRQEPRTFSVSLLGSCIYGGMIILQSYLLGAITTHVVTPALAQRRVDRAALAISVVAILAVAGLKIAGIIARRLAAGVLQYDMQATYRRAVTRQYLRLPLSWHAKHPTGQLLSNANSDVEAAWYPVAPFPFAVGVCVIIVVTLVLLFLTNVVLALVGCVVFPTIVAINSFYVTDMSPRVSRSQQLRAEVSGIAHESFDGALVVKTLGKEDFETARFTDRVVELRDALIHVGRLRGLFDPVLEAIPNLGVLVVLLVGASRVDTGTLVQVAYLFGLLAFPLRAIGWVLAEIPRSVVGWDRVQNVLQENGEMPFGAEALAGAGGAALTARAVGFAYEGHPPVLTGIDLDLRPGTTVAVVGSTGAGKSTLASLLVRLHDPVAGAVALDGTDLRALAAGQLAEHVALVPQQTFVFDDSVRGNVTLGADVPDEQVWWALRLAQADGFVARLDHGLDTLVGERGTSLSGGQRQRLALARALVRRPRLLVLDDATSAVDTSVERAILDGLRDEVEATTLVVAYRKATIALADEVLLLADGRIVDRGSHDELLGRNERYADIVNAYDVPAATP